MSQELEAELQAGGYDAATARELVKLADDRSDSDSRAFLKEIVGANTINIYIEQRKRQNQGWATSEARQSSGKSPAPRSLNVDSSPSRSQSQQSSSKPRPKLPSNVPYSIPLFHPTRKDQREQSPKTSGTAQSRQTSTQIKVESIKDLDSALRQLEVSSSTRSKCDCMGSRHGLLEVSPNCLNCGNIICNKEGIGPCLSCGQPLVNEETLSKIYEVLKQERQDIVSSMGKKALKSAGIDAEAFKNSALLERLEHAEANRDKLLDFQASGAVRTRIIDQVADFETPDAGINRWASPEEQALQLRNQQRQLRKQDELRKIRSGRGRKVVSIDIRGNKVYKTVSDVMPSDSDEENEPGEGKEGGQKDSKSAPKDTEAPEYFFDPKKYGRNWERPHLRHHDTPTSDASVQANLEPPVVQYSEDQLLTSTLF